MSHNTVLCVDPSSDTSDLIDVSFREATMSLLERSHLHQMNHHPKKFFSLYIPRLIRPKGSGKWGAGARGLDDVSLVQRAFDGIARVIRVDIVQHVDYKSAFVHLLSDEGLFRRVSSSMTLPSGSQGLPFALPVHVAGHRFHLHWLLLLAHTQPTHSLLNSHQLAHIVSS